MTKPTNNDFALLFRDGAFLDLQVSYWRGHTKLELEDLGLNPAEVPDIFTLGQKRLVPKEVLDGFRAVEATARGAIGRYSLDFPIPGTHFVPTRVRLDLEDSLVRAKGRFIALKADLLDRYEVIQAKMLAAYPDHWEALAKAFPPQADLERRFKFGWLTFTLMPQDENDAKDLLRQFVTATVGGLRGEAVAILTRLEGKLDGNSALTETDLKSFRAFLSRFTALDVFKDQGTADALARVEKAAQEAASAFREQPALAAELKSVVTIGKQAIQAAIPPEDVAEGYRRLMP